jgi:fatty acid desaturase
VNRRADLPRPAVPIGLWRRFELPNWIVAAAIYGAWILLVYHAHELAWYVVAPLGAYVLAWHFSLQHEAIHGWLSAPRWLRAAVVWPPIGGWLPFELYRRSHSQHHRDAHLTMPVVDTESAYHHEQDWRGYSRGWRSILLFNQTLMGRMLIGPLLRWRKLIMIEAGLLRQRDFRNVGIWLRFFVGLAAVLGFVAWAGYPIWKYYLFIVYPGLSLGLLRSFIEHRWGESPDHRIAIVESNGIFGLLFLWNNIHVVHHIYPSMPWYDIKPYYGRHRGQLLALNDAYVFPGYLDIARRWLLRPVFVPVYPGTAQESADRPADPMQKTD